MSTVDRLAAMQALQRRSHAEIVQLRRMLAEVTHQQEQSATAAEAMKQARLKRRDEHRDLLQVRPFN